MNRQSEMMVIGVMLLAAEQRNIADAIARQVRPEMLTCGAAQSAWSKIQALRESGVVPGLVEMRQAGSDVEYIVQAMESVGSVVNWKHYCKNVRESYALREIDSRSKAIALAAREGNFKKARELSRLILDGLGDPSQVRFTVEDSLLEMDLSKLEVLKSGLGIMDAPQAGGGWVKGELSLIGAATGRGKTLLAIQSALAILRGGGVVGFGTLELPHRRITQRMIQMICGYRSKGHAEKFNDGAAWDSAYDEFMGFRNRLTYYDPCADLGKKRFIEPFIEWVLAEMDANPLDAFFFDYLQLARPERSLGSRNEDVNEVAIQLTGLANKTGAAGVVLAQLKPKDGELRLRHSYDPEDHMAAMVYRGSVEMGRGKDATKVEAWWHEKNRHFPMLAQSVKFDENHLTVSTTGVLER